MVGRRAAVMLAAFLILTGLAGRAAALGSKTILVSNGNDAGVGSLRQAVAEAKNGDTVRIEKADLLIKLQSPIVISADITVETPSGMNKAIITTDEESRLFVTSGAVTLKNLELVGGKALGEEPIDQVGGAVLNLGALTLDSVSVKDSRALLYGGGIYNLGSLTLIATEMNNNEVTHPAGCGGAVANVAQGAGSVAKFEVRRARFMHNEAPGGGGAVCNLAGDGGKVLVDLFNLRADSNRAGSGAVLANADDGTGEIVMTVSEATFVGNLADFGGVIANSGPGSDATFTNVTASKNNVLQEGLFSVSVFGAKLRLQYSTVVENVVFGGGNSEATTYYVDNGGQTEIMASISQNSAEECNDDAGHVDEGANVNDDETCWRLHDRENELRKLHQIEHLVWKVGDLFQIATRRVLGEPQIHDYIPAGSYGCGTAVTTSANGVIRPQAVHDHDFCTPGAHQPEARDLIIKKEAPDDTALDDLFEFSFLAAQTVDFILAPGESYRTKVANGGFTFDEYTGEEWAFAGVSCVTDSGVMVEPVIFSDALNPQIEVIDRWEGTLTCTVKNSPRNLIIVNKRADKPGDFEFDLEGGPGLYEREKTLQEDGQWTIRDVPAGSYTLKENVNETYWQLERIECEGESFEIVEDRVEISFDDDKRYTVVCTFTNASTGVFPPRYQMNIPFAAKGKK